MSFHRLERAKDRDFWSVRVGSDIRLIVHRTTGSLLRRYVAHHDRAERRRLHQISTQADRLLGPSVTDVG